jgi:hypothetical protein
MDVRTQFMDGQSHQVTLYLQDVGPNGRNTRVQVINNATGAALDTQELYVFGGGRYLSWNVSGNVTFRLTTIGGPNSVLNGIFFDPVQPPQPPAPGLTFPLWDAMTFTGKPDLEATQRMKPLHINSQEFWSGSYPNWDNHTPSEANTRALARRVYDQQMPLVIDIEHMPMDVRFAPTAQVDATLNTFAQILDWVNSERPGLDVGMFAVSPLMDYWVVKNLRDAERNPTNPYYAGNRATFEANYNAWVAANDYVRNRLASKVDFVAPTLYTHYEDRVGWHDYADAAVSEARKWNKPLRPFLWSEYHPGSEDALVGRQIPGDFWQEQLGHVSRIADGAILWGGLHFTGTHLNNTSTTAAWDESAPWWSVTKQFVTAHLA